jgi:hypothetical protein
MERSLSRSSQPKSAIRASTLGTLPSCTANISSVLSTGLAEENQSLRFRLRSPGFDDIAVFDNAAAPAQGHGHRVDSLGVEIQIAGLALLPVRGGKHRLGGRTLRLRGRESRTRRLAKGSETNGEWQSTD